MLESLQLPWPNAQITLPCHGSLTFWMFAGTSVVMSTVTVSTGTITVFPALHCNDQLDL